MAKEVDKQNEESELKLPAVPPVFFVIPLIVGGLVEVYLLDGDFISESLGLVIGIVMIVAGVLLGYWTWKTLNSFGESPDPRHATESIVTSGPFARSRNPVYLSWVIIGLGIALALNTAVLIVATFVGALAVHVFVIKREEAYLNDKFGEPYEQYVDSVRPWI